MRSMLLELVIKIILGVLLLVSCRNSPQKLPIIGFQEELPNGEIEYHKIPEFSFTNQLGDTITNAAFKDQIYIADFFFTSCPSICPKVMKQMLRIYDDQADNTSFQLVSHTIDPKRDTEAALLTYSNNLDIDHSRWHFLTGDKDELMDMAEEYYVAAYEDASVPGGFDHSGKILLIDQEGHIRAFCDGTDEDDVTDFMKDIDILIAEYE